MDADELRDFWTDARVRGGLNPAEAYLGRTPADTMVPPAWAFGSDVEEADRLLGLVLEGRKTATASAYWDYEEEARQRGAGDAEVDLEVALPQPGLLSIILDGRDHPRALIRTTDVQVVPFGEVGEEHARREGEGSLEEWRRVHREFFGRHAPPGRTVDADTMVVLERFVVLVPATARRLAARLV